MENNGKPIIIHLSITLCQATKKSSLATEIDSHTTFSMIISTEGIYQYIGQKSFTTLNQKNSAIPLNSKKDNYLENMKN